MRHIPTALYIDTEVFYRNGLRFDTKDFVSMRETFVKGGIRLLVPLMMEQELLRHFREMAKKSANEFLRVHMQHPIKYLSLLKVPTAIELEERCLDVFHKQWEEFKSHFTVEALPLAGRLEDVVNWYFQIEAPFSEKKPKEFPDAFILSALESYHRDHSSRIAVVSFDGDFTKACAKRSFIRHFDKLYEYIEAFQPELSRKVDDEIIDPTKPIVTEDLTEMKTLLGRGAGITEIERNRVVHLLSKRGSNYDYFFRHANHALWIEPLLKGGFFANPPATERFENGQIRIPIWPPIDYLVRVFEQAPDGVIIVLESLPKTDNIRILEGILRIVIKSNNSELVIKFYNCIEAFIDFARWGHETLIELLAKPYFFEGRLRDFASPLLLKIVEFRPDPMAAEKLLKRKEDPNDWSTSLKPAPRFGTREYQQILEHGIGPMTNREPFAIARILIDATASLIRLRTNREDVQKDSDEDISEAWCRRLDRSERHKEDSKVALVHALTMACKAVYENAPEAIDSLDQALRNQHGKLFKRLRQFLYALHPNDQTLPWIREFILSHEDYDKWEYHHEFQLMIRKASEHFCEKLLSEEERRTIFDKILKGPSKESFHEWLGDRYSDDVWTRRQRYFHRKQLRPFASVIFSEYRTTYEELERELVDEPLTDESFSPISETRGGTVSYRSPYTVEDLSALSDEDLLTTINEWDDSHCDQDDWLIEINIEALAEAFQSVFKEIIVPNEIRLAFWLNNRALIERPVYIKAMTKGMHEITKAQKFEKLNQWLEFCRWILDHFSDSLAQKDGGSCRRAVGDFIGFCLEKDVNVPFSARGDLAGLLRSLCTQLDARLDHDRPVLLNRNDQVTEAINNTRSRALEDLVNFGYWVRHHKEDADVPELREILECRFSDDASPPLSLPESALLGMQFRAIWSLDNDWGEANRARFFPQNNLPVWVEAFSAFISFNHPFLRIFEVLRDDFVFALAHLDALQSTKDTQREVVDTLGQHLFTYYLWDVYPLQGDNSLLRIFYDKTTNDRSHWGSLFDHVGRSLRNSGPKLDQPIQDRILAFFEWRFDQKETVELKEFTFWLEAACLAPDWRLNAYSQVLEISRANDVSVSIEIDTLNELLEQHTPKVVECFAKITDQICQDQTIYIQTDKAKSILQAGMKSLDDAVRSNAERARENLLKGRHFAFLEMDE